MSSARVTADREKRLLLTALLDSPPLSLGILGMSAIHVALAGTGAGGWPCPFARVTGWPCPGCGLGRACGALLKGDWMTSLRLHAYAPVLFLMLGILLTGLILRGKPRERFHGWIRTMEERTFIVPAAMFGLLVYWLLRFVLDFNDFHKLVK